MGGLLRKPAGEQERIITATSGEALAVLSGLLDYLLDKDEEGERLAGVLDVLEGLDISDEYLRGVGQTLSLIIAERGE